MARIGDKQVYTVEYFDGGLNNNYSDNVLADNESPLIQNVESDSLGDAGTRRGSLVATHSSTTGNLATGVWYGLARLEVLTGTSMVVGWYNSSLVVASAGSYNSFTSGSLTFSTVPSADGVFTALSDIAHVYYNNTIYQCDGGIPYKYDGTAFTRMGIDTPSNTLSATTAATASTNLGSGTYYYKVAYVNSAGIGGDLPTTALTFVAQASSIVSITGIPTAPVSFGIGKRFLYRTLVDDPSVYYFLDEIADNTTTTYKDETPDSDLVEQAPLDQGYPPSFNLIVQHKDRIWAVEENGSTLKYSEVGRPELWPAENEEPLGDGAGKIKLIAVHNDGILAIKNDGSGYLLFLSDNDPNNFIPIKLNIPFGTVCRFAHGYEDNMLYLGTIGNKPQGFIALKGLQPINESITTDEGATQSEMVSDRITPDIERLSESLIEKIQGIGFRNRLFIAMPYQPDDGTTITTNTRIYQFDYQRRTISKQIGAWFPFTDLYAAYFTVFKDRLLYVPPGERSVGHVFQIDVEDRYADDTYTAAGVFTKNRAIDSLMLTKRFNCGDAIEQNHKDFRTAYLWAGLLGNYSMDMYSRVDFDGGIGDLSTIDLTPQGSYWGLFSWGSRTWGGSDTQGEFDIDLGQLSGRRIQFRFTNQNTANQAFLVKRIGIEFTLRPRRRYLTGGN